MQVKEERVPQPMSPEKARHLLHPARRLIDSPKRLVRHLALAPDATVLELGPGPGYFSPEVARAVPQGRLVLVDVQQEMLDMARERLECQGLTNVDYVRGDAVSLPLESDGFDAAFLVAVLGEVPDRAAALREIHRVLRPGGLLSITEVKLGDPDAIARPELERLVEAAGFRKCMQYGPGFNYTLGFRKPSVC